jgi:hypothetical protein
MKYDWASQVAAAETNEIWTVMIPDHRTYFTIQGNLGQQGRWHFHLHTDILYAARLITKIHSGFVRLIDQQELMTLYPDFSHDLEKSLMWSLLRR